VDAFSCNLAALDQEQRRRHDILAKGPVSEASWDSGTTRWVWVSLSEQPVAFHGVVGVGCSGAALLSLPYPNSRIAAWSWAYLA